MIHNHTRTTTIYLPVSRRQPLMLVLLPSRVPAEVVPSADEEFHPPAAARLPVVVLLSTAQQKPELGGDHPVNRASKSARVSVFLQTCRAIKIDLLNMDVFVNFGFQTSVQVRIACQISLAGALVCMCRC